MGKVENAFKMLMLIKEHGILKCEELSKILNVTERQVQKYVWDMRKAGINIKSKSGTKGGYYIEECPFCNKNIINIGEDKNGN